MTDMRFTSFKIKSYDEGAGTVEGYASRFGIKDQVNDIVDFGAFKKSIEQMPNVRFLWQHKKDEPIGIIEHLHEDQKGLYIKARFASTQRAQECRELMKMGALDSFSIGYRVPKGKMVIEHTKDGQQVQRLTEIQLHEVSVVTFPCNVEARMTGVKSSLEGRFADLSLEDQKQVSDFMDFLVSKSAKPIDPDLDDDDDSQNPDEADDEGMGTDADCDAVGTETDPDVDGDNDEEGSKPKSCATGDSKKELEDAIELLRKALRVK